MKKMTIREAFERKGINIIDECEVTDAWWIAKSDKSYYLIELVNGHTDWNIRYHMTRYEDRVNGKLVRGTKVCTRANLDKVISLIRSN